MSLRHPEIGAFCSHCNQRVASKPRRLCWECYQDRGIRQMYPTKNRSRNERYKAMCEPTSARPGSELKLQILRDRMEAGLPLWSPEDLHFDDVDLD